MIFNGHTLSPVREITFKPRERQVLNSKTLQLFQKTIMRNSVEDLFQVNEHCPPHKPFIHMATNFIRKEGKSELNRMICAKARLIRREERVF